MQSSVLQLIVVYVLVFQAYKTSSLQCFDCSSHHSWEDCSKTQTLVNCSSVLNTCVTYHRVLSLPSGEKIHEFEKGCWDHAECSASKCRETTTIVTDSQCDLQCCNTTLCNDGVTQSPSDHFSGHANYTLRSQHVIERNNSLQSLHKDKTTNAPKAVRKISPSLQCFDCSSHRSWEDCRKKQTLVNCSSVLNVCVTYHRVLTLPRGHQENEFEKGCWSDRECSNRECRKTSCRMVEGSWCDMKCCNTTFCNRGGSMVVSARQVNNKGSIVESKYGIIAILSILALGALIPEIMGQR